MNNTYKKYIQFIPHQNYPQKVLLYGYDSEQKILNNQSTLTTMGLKCQSM